MVTSRLRIRFTKEGDLRLISHRDLVRTMERLFRRADLPLALSQGFHPKARMTLPAALALGIEGCNEVMDIHLAGEFTSSEVQARLSAAAIEGIHINSVELLAATTPKARVTSATYRVPVPPRRREQLQAAVDQLKSQTSHIVNRAGAKRELDLMADLQELRLEDDALVFVLSVRNEGAVRASEVLEALAAADLLELGFPLKRTDLELAS